MGGILIMLAAIALLGLLLGVLIWASKKPGRAMQEPPAFIMRPPRGWENLSGAEYEEAEVERIEEAFALDEYDRLFGDEPFSRAEGRRENRAP